MHSVLLPPPYKDKEMSMQTDIEFKYENYPEMEQVREHIKACEGLHPQQVAYSTFHDALTQICFGCRVIRSSLKKIWKKDISF